MKNTILFIKPILFILIFILLFIELIKIPLPKYNKNNNNNSSNSNNNILENFKNNRKNNKINIHNNNIKLEKKMEFTKNEIQFLSSNDSNELFNNNPYLNTMNNINIKARQFSNLEDIIQKYKTQSLKTITKKEKEAFFWFLQHLIIKSDILSPFIYNQLFNKNVMIAKSNSWLEHNMPHTHKNVIILNQEWFDEIIFKEKDNLVLSALNNEGAIFMHELIHVHQRYNIKRYEKLYYNWGFIKPKYIHNSETFFKMNRCNPDGNDLEWIWNDKKNNKYYMIGATYNNENPSNILDLSYISREVTRSHRNIFNHSNIKKDIQLYKNDGFIDYFNIFNNHYHPNEITSQYMEFYLNNILDGNTNINDNNNDNDNNDSKAYKIFKENIKKILYGKKKK